MNLRYCPFCSSSKITFGYKMTTSEEERDTELWYCKDCKEVIFRERLPKLEKGESELLKKYGDQAIQVMVESGDGGYSD